MNSWTFMRVFQGLLTIHQKAKINQLMTQTIYILLGCIMLLYVLFVFRLGLESRLINLLVNSLCENEDGLLIRQYQHLTAWTVNTGLRLINTKLARWSLYFRTHNVDPLPRFVLQITCIPASKTLHYEYLCV